MRFARMTHVFTIGLIALSAPEHVPRNPMPVPWTARGM